MNHSGKCLRDRIATLVIGALALIGTSVEARQVDLAGPAGSVDFGASVTVLPNGNFVVAASGQYSDGDSQGAVYLYSPEGQLISTLVGSSEGDVVGVGGVVVLANGNFVIVSPEWDHEKGAVTWADADLGVSGFVSAANSLVGDAMYDRVGTVTPLRNGNFVVDTSNWSGGLGAVTWVDGSVGMRGFVSADNSLIGATAGDQIGNAIIELATGDYVVASQQWTNAGAQYAGAVTWCPGDRPIVAVVSAENSLVGSHEEDWVGNVVLALPNGNYVAGSVFWNDGAGSVTWGAADGSTLGVVDASNSLVGALPTDQIGTSITVLASGNYVVASPQWKSASGDNLGAVTWADGLGATVGHVDPSQSIIGSASGDRVGTSVTALADGNFVIASQHWNGEKGAVTWEAGGHATGAVVSDSNSIVGAAYGDQIGSADGTASENAVLGLLNGSYVVASWRWNDSRGALTWIEGGAPRSGVVDETNSIVGSQPGDAVGDGSLVALSSGNYVVGSPNWNGSVGAVTWGQGDRVSSGSVSATNSLRGLSTFDHVGLGDILALPNGNYAVVDSGWTELQYGSVGAIAWGDGRRGTFGTVGTSNALIGSDFAPVFENTAFVASNSDIIVFSPAANSGSSEEVGAVTMLRGTGPTTGFVDASNTVVANAAQYGITLRFAHDTARDRLLVGRPLDNTVTILTLDSLLRNGFD